MQYDRLGNIILVSQACSYCNTECERPKKCAQCKMVRYCSKECQRLAWKLHKLRCAPGYLQQTLEDPDLYRRNKNFSSWLDCWKFMLNSFALSALDIYGHGGDYGRVKTHALILFIEPRVNPKVKNNSTLFEVTEMKVMAWSEVMAKLAEGDVDEDDLKRMDFEMADNQVRWGVFYDTLFRMLTYQTTFNEPQPSKLGKNWQADVKKLILDGQDFWN